MNDYTINLNKKTPLQRFDEATAGYKTYAGILLIALGFFGATDIISPEDAQTLVRAIVQVVGILVAAYGRYKATRGS